MRSNAPVLKESPLSAISRSALIHRVLLTTSFVVGQFIVLWALILPLASTPWWQGFRGYFANDQLSYAAIALAVSKGNFAAVEPLTETGTSHYPSLWYLILGTTSWLTNQPVYLLWTVMGLTVVCLTIAFLGVLAYRVSGLAIAPLLPALAILTGTFSFATSQWWYTSLGYHAVIWGPFGTLFTLNAEAIGLMGNLLALGLLTHAAAFTRWRSAAFLLAALVLGVLANVQTYAFLTGVSVTAAFIATLALVRYPSLRRTMTTVGLLAVILLLGPWIAQTIGPLPLFVLVIASTTPALLPLRQLHAGQLALAGIVFAAAASPQVIRTLIGLASGDDFLTYRQDSTQGLGIELSIAWLAAIPAFAIIAFNIVTLIALRGQKDDALAKTFAVLLVSLGIGMVIMSSNDVWGFDQEPYRFWLQYLFLAIFLGAVMTAWSMHQWRSLTVPWRTISIGIGALALIIWAASLSDVRAFREFAMQQGVINVADDRGRALQVLVPADEGLVLSSACLDPQVLKLITRAPVAYFNRGLAWPDNRVAIDAFFDPQRGRDLIPDELNASGVTFVLTDAACADEWRVADARIQPVAVQPYAEGLFTLWQVRAPEPASEGS